MTSASIFRLLACKYGNEVRILFSDVLNLNLKFLRNRMAISFLKRCRQSGYIPRHISGPINRLCGYFDPRASNYVLEKWRRGAQRFLLQFEINSHYDRLQRLQESLHVMESIFSSAVRCDTLFCLAFKYVRMRVRREEMKIRRRHDRKLEQLPLPLPRNFDSHMSGTDGWLI